MLGVICFISHVVQPLPSLYIYGPVSYLLPMTKMLSWTGNSIWHWSKQNIARLAQVKNEGREAWNSIFTTYIRSTGSNLCSRLINIFIKNSGMWKTPILPNWLIIFSHKKPLYLSSIYFPFSCPKKNFFSDKSLQFNVNYSHTRGFTL